MAWWSAWAQEPQSRVTDPARMPEHVRQAAVADMFYPGDADRLATIVDELLAQATPTSYDGELRALLVPHAGYMFSGGVAATALKHLEGTTYDTIVVVGVSHRVTVPGAALARPGAFETPLGRYGIDREAVKRLTEFSPIFTVDDGPHRAEHSVEVIVPFLQRLQPDALLVPVVMGNPTLETAQDRLGTMSIPIALLVENQSSNALDTGSSGTISPQRVHA